MPLKKFNSLSLLLPLLLLFSWNAAAAGPRVNKASQRNLRLSSPVAAVVSGLDAAALSTTSIQWSWSTGSYTGIDGFYLYSSSTAVKITLSSSTAFYIDAGLEADKAYTRWLTAYNCTGSCDEGGDSPHMQKFTYAVPPAEIAISSDAPTAAPTVNSLALPWARRTDTIVSTSAYAEIPPAYWFPNPVHASAYAMECSTDGGTTYVRNRTVFVPWETFPVLSNNHYMIRLGAVNGDDELTPGIYSATRTFTTPPLTPSTFTAVAISSYSIQWLWDKDMFAGTGITGFNVYRSTLTAEDSLPGDRDEGEILATLGANTSYWTEVFVDSTTLAANSRHTRWVKAFGYLESEKSRFLQKYTYATAPASATVVWIDPDPYWVAHVEEESLSLHWPIQGASTAIFSGDWRPGIASQYVIDHSTTAGFTVAVTSAIGGAPPRPVAGLDDNTKYDLRIGAVNGDGEQTPADALNPFAYSQAYKVMTRPGPVDGFSFAPWTDTAMHTTWSTAPYTHPEYISGYKIGDKHSNPDGTVYWDPLDTLIGVTSNQYNLDYLLTNSLHTITIWVDQQDPDWAAGNPHFDAVPKHWEYYYNNFGSYGRDTDGYTFATPPNDVSFYEVRSSTIGITWNEPIVPATKYRVERSTSLNGPEAQRPWVFVSSVTGNTFEDTGLTPYTTYSYRIGAINLLGFQTVGMSTNTDGHRRDYGFVSSTLTKHISPTMLGTATSTNAINWAWTNTVPGVLSYNLYTSSDGIVVTGLGAATTFYVEVNLSSANARHTRRVRSYTSFGEGDYSQAAVSTLANPPAAPVITSSGVHNMALEWLDSDGSTRYSLDRSTDKISWTPLKTWADIFVSTWLADTGLRFASTYYYAVGGYNQDGILSVSSSISAANMTLPLPAAYSAVFATAAVSQNVTAPITGVGLVTVAVPAGAADGYFFISTSAFASPADITKANLDAATAKLTSVSLLTGSIVELHLYDIYGSPLSSDLPSPARVSMIYTDANNDDIVDGTSAQAVSLRLFSLDTGALVWNQIANSILDNGANTVYADIPHFSFYALGSVTSAAGTIADVFAYPNPYKPGSSGVFGESVYGEGIVFESLPAGSEVRIFSLAGGLVRELSDDDGDGRCLWDARNADGARAASGTYVYLVTSPAGGKKSGRIAIIK